MLNAFRSGGSFLLALGLVGGLASASHAATILINFTDSDLANNLTNWNNLSSGGTANNVNNHPDLAAGSVIDNTGAVVPGLSVTTSGFNEIRNNGLTGYASGSGVTMAPWMNATAARIGWLNSTNDGTIVFGGLNASDTYTIELVSARSAAAISGTYQVNGVATATEVSSTNFSSQGSGWTGGKVLIWSDLVPVGGTLTLKEIGTNYGTFNAIRFTSVPEPSALLGAVVVTGLVLRRRRSES